ncbi:NAD(+) diphosphatase [Kangiella marina]|uniref:NAD(+) diphosphatase n=1 Tax=Kangiella marina TaxID=1079178 RepID=A0ABP8IF66_9GAMM
MFAFQENPLNRHGDIRHTPDFISKVIDQAQTRFLPVFKQSIACTTQEDHKNPLWLSYDQLSTSFGEVNDKHLIYLGELDSKHYFTYRLKSAQLIDNIQKSLTHTKAKLCNLRDLLHYIDTKQAHLCNVAVAMEHWHNSHQYCGQCGSETYSTQAGFVRTCADSECQQLHFPRTDSAVICAITYEDKLLLGRQKNWPEKRYSVIAGFVEPGETLEQAVAREAYEETGLVLSTINYYQSQPWPFPQSLMVGFTAESATSDIKLRDQELEEARWFSKNQINTAINNGSLVLPFEYSISRTLINQWLTK